MKTVVEKAPDAGFKNNLPFGGGGDSALGGGGGGNVVVHYLSQANNPAERALDDDSSDYGPFLNKFKSELAGLSSATPSTIDSFKSATGKSSSIDVDTTISYGGLSEVYEKRFDNWVDDLREALNDVNSYYGIEKSALVGSEGSNDSLERIEELDDLLLELRILNLESDRGMVRRYRNADVYYSGLAELTGEISFDDAFRRLVQASDEERIALRKEIIDRLKERGIGVLSKSTIEASVLSRTKNQDSMTSSGSSLSGGISIARRASSSSGYISAKTLSHGFYGIDSEMSMASSARPQGYWDRRGSLGSRRSSLLSSSSRKSSSSGNSSGVSFDPKKPDTSKAFNRPSAKKKRFTKK